MKLTENEMLVKNSMSMYKYTRMLNRGNISIDELSDFVPGLLHVNSLQNVRLHYCCHKSLDFLEVDIDNVKINGSDILKNLLHPSTFSKISTSLAKNCFKKDDIATTYQQIRSVNSDIYVWYYSLKRVLNKNESFSITQPISNLGKPTRLIQKFLELEPWLEKKLKPFLSLSHRENEIFRLVAIGKSSTEISEGLFISRQTVSTHRKNIYKKLQITGITELVRIADYYL